jgi:hypothetical protein
MGALLSANLDQPSYQNFVNLDHRNLFMEVPAHEPEHESAEITRG